eukprot:TRINITY_DN3345_c0_g1_i1.p1 TRINITY_DN3345_c0_g1~~TRINITY_DN3345_c0_g1_i1.p1  ORF type:complete len:176 (+),score=22.71 TRINITY_DN3345_c0_g1_i1:30-530(+)
MAHSIQNHLHRVRFFTRHILGSASNIMMHPAAGVHRGIAQASACSNGDEMLRLQRWAVVGRSSNSIVQQLLEKLSSNGREVVHIDPYGSSAEDVPKSLAELPEDVCIDVVDLCAKPALGLQVAEDCIKRQIQNVFIQPGASSDEIVNFCQEKGIKVHHGCVLRDMI